MDLKRAELNHNQERQNKTTNKTRRGPLVHDVSPSGGRPFYSLAIEWSGAWVWEELRTAQSAEELGLMITCWWAS